MQRRVLIGVAGTAVLGALALVDLGSLQPKPSKPLFFYLTPLVRVEVRLPMLCAINRAGSVRSDGQPQPSPASCCSCAQALIVELDEIIGEGRWGGDRSSLVSALGHVV